MADDTDREASELRLRAMAADYEARATAADGLTRPAPLDKTDNVSTAPTESEIGQPKVGSKLTLGLKGTTSGERRPIGRLKLRTAAPDDLHSAPAPVQR